MDTTAVGAAQEINPVGFIRQTEFIRQDLFVKDSFARRDWTGNA